MARKILLADDSVTAQNMGRKILTEAGYEVVTVNNGAAALKKVSEIKPDLVVLDVYMPGYGGLEVCERVKEGKETARIPVLLTVGKLEPFKSDDARRVHADAHIVKPFEASELLTAISKLEDRIVPQAQGKKFGRVTRKSALEPDGSELQDGWRERLPKPIAKDKKTSLQSRAETADENSKVIEMRPADTVPPEPRRTAEDGARQSHQETVGAPMASDSSLEPTAIADSGSSAHQQNAPAQELSAASVVAEMAVLIGPNAAESEPLQSRLDAEGVSGHAASSAARLAENEVAAALSALIPPSAGQEPASFAANGFVPADLLPSGLTGPRWIAEEVALGEEESRANLEQEMADFHKASPAIRDPEAIAQTAAIAESDSKPLAEAHLLEPDPLMCELHSQEAACQGAAADNSDGQGEANSESASAVSSAGVAVEQPITEPVAAYAAAAGAGSETSPQASIASETRVEVSADAPANSNWEHLRDSLLRGENIGEQLASLQSQELSHTESAAQHPGDDPAANASQADAIASIVDSVLADLKPKLIAEIAKRMGNNPIK